jgi:hypothetical protein
LNRLCALRMAEACELLIESIARGYQSDGFQLYIRLAGSSLGEIGDAYRNYLFSIFDEFAVDLPVLFDRFSPQGRLFPREAVLMQLLDVINHAEIESLWGEDETIGWVYQYFNSSEERRQMRAESSAPRNSRELAVRNQFFTPRYVVEFLTDNTLGRIWYEMRKGDTSLKDECRYLVRRPNEIFLAPGETAPPEAEEEIDLSQEELLNRPVYIEHQPKKDPRDIKILDPACGSGHFLLYAFDLLEHIYEEAWEDPENIVYEETSHTLREDFGSLNELHRSIPKLIIEHNLHGIDIDPRAVQIAALALWLRAQKEWKAIGIKSADRPQVLKSNIVTAEPMPGDEEMRREFTSGLKPRVLGQLVHVVFEKMKLAGEAGSLLKIEEEIKDTIAEAKKRWLEGLKPEQRFLFPGMIDPQQKQQELRFDLEGVTDERFWEQAEDQILDVLNDYSKQAENNCSIRRRMFAEDAARGFSFIDLSRKRYDVVLMNPPFGEAITRCKQYFGANYKEAISDIGMMFVSCYGGKLGEGGRLGAITNRTCLATSQLEKWRRLILLGRCPMNVVADLGFGVLDAAMVETCAYVITNDKSNKSFVGFRLLESRDKGIDLLVLINSWQRGMPEPRYQLGNHDYFQRLPLAVISYWAPFVMMHKLIHSSRLGDNEQGANDGGHTGDDFRFIRSVWEVDNASIGMQKVHLFFAKGGEYSPMWDDIHLLVNWKDEGKEVREISGARIYHEDLHFKAGLTYPLRTTSDFSPRVLPAHCIFSTGGHGIHFRDLEDALLFLGFSYTRLAKIFIEILFGGGDASVSGSAARNYTAGTIKMLPLPSVPVEERRRFIRVTENLIYLFREGFTADETSRYFITAPMISPSNSLVSGIQQYVESEIKRLEKIANGMRQLELYSFNAFGLNKENVEEIINIVYGEHPDNYSYRDIVADLPKLFEMNLSSLMGEAAVSVGIRNRSITKKSFFIDRTIDLICHSLKTTPAAICDGWQKISYVATDRKIETTKGLLIYLFGIIFGRWDIRIPLDHSLTPKLPDPFDPLPICPPGMLVSPDGLPAAPGRIVGDEWLRARPDANSPPPEEAFEKPTIKDSEYPLHISWDGILADDSGFNSTQPHQEDIVRRIREVLELIWKDKAHEIEQEACDILGVKTLREYFSKPSGFFQDHLKRYSKSRRKAPIYWPLSTASGSYTLWLYYHRITDQILFTCVNDYLDPKLKQITEDMQKLKLKDKRIREEERELEYLSDLELELKDFREELLRIAAFWKPNLNDGVQITAAPLWKLFKLRSWQKTLKDTWEKLEAGEYDWAHLAYSIWPERVREKCKTDKSLAIGHDLEHLYEG